MVGDRDVLDYGLDIEPGVLHVPELVVTLSDRRTAVTGTVRSSAQPPSTYFVVAFPADPALRQASSRRVQVTRPDRSGAYTLRDLPSGEYFLSALSDFVAEDLLEPAFFDGLANESIRLVLSEGEQRRLDLGIGGS
jgi:hypothetical protein